MQAPPRWQPCERAGMVVDGSVARRIFVSKDRERQSRNQMGGLRMQRQRFARFPFESLSRPTDGILVPRSGSLA